MDSPYETDIPPSQELLSLNELFARGEYIREPEFEWVLPSDTESDVESDVGPEFAPEIELEDLIDFENLFHFFAILFRVYFGDFPTEALIPRLQLAFGLLQLLLLRRYLTFKAMDTRKKKKKVLLMGKSGSGKSSMRSIIFSNYVAKDVRRLGATIDVEHSHVKFMGNLTLNLWDCGGQDAFMETYLASQRENVFSDVAVLIYVFDIESREVERDLDTYGAIIKALKEFSPSAYVFCLVHKMDLIQNEHRQRIYEERSALIRSRSDSFTIDTFGSSIWDQSLYKAWAGIVHKMIPNLHAIARFLEAFAKKVNAEEVILFERTTFLTVTSFVSEIGSMNPNKDRHERLSNIMKTFKHCVARNTQTTPASAGFIVQQLKTQQFNIFMARFTDNTYIFVVVHSGEAAYNCAVLNTLLARDAFVKAMAANDAAKAGTTGREGGEGVAVEAGAASVT